MYLGNPVTARMFGRLDQAHHARPDLALSTDLIVGFPGESEKEEKLLRRARKEDAPVSHAEVARLDRRQKAEAPRSKAEPATGEARVEGDAPDAAAPSSEEHVVWLTSGQLRQLIERLGGSADGEDALVDCLLALLAGPDPV